MQLRILENSEKENLHANASELNSQQMNLVDKVASFSAFLCTGYSQHEILFPLKFVFPVEPKPRLLFLCEPFSFEELKFTLRTQASRLKFTTKLMDKRRGLAHHFHLYLGGPCFCGCPPPPPS
jgi:hypothetical protein